MGEFKETLKKYRKELVMTQEKFGEMVGLIIETRRGCFRVNTIIGESNG